MEYLFIQKYGELLQHSSLEDKVLRSPIIAIDTETTGLDPHSDKLRLVQISTGNTPVLVIDCFTFLPDGLPFLTQLLTSNAIKIFQNAKFDLQFFLQLGVCVSLPLFDTMLAAQLLRTSGGPPKVNLAALSQHFLQEELVKEEQKSNFSGVLRKEQIEYAAKDSYILLRLREKMIPLLLENKLVEVAKIEFGCVRAVAQMEYCGIYVDMDRWETLRLKTLSERAEALERLYVYTGQPSTQLSLFGEDIVSGFPFNSNKQVLKLLHQNDVPVPDTSHHSLMAYCGHPLVSALLVYRKTEKSLSSFLDPMPKLIHPKTGRLHPHYGQIGAWSGRTSCSGPNIQQIPRDKAFRECFRAPAGRKLVMADYSQIELRVAAQITRDARMLAAYGEGGDLHRLTAALISGKDATQITKNERQSAKAVNFGLIFSMGAAGLQAYAKDTYGVDMTLEDATLFRNRFFKAYRGIAAWHENLKQNPPTETRTLAGRKHVFGENPGLSILSNTPVQGSAADIVKQALARLVDALQGTNAFIVAMVHDEIILECDTAEAASVSTILKETMENAAKRYLPQVPAVAEVEIAESWAEK